MPTHKKPESERFKGPAKYAEYLVARAIITVLQRLPIGVAYRLGRGVGWLAWKLMARRRATVYKNLKIVNAWMGAQSADGGARMANIEDEVADGEGRRNKGATCPSQDEPFECRRRKSQEDYRSAMPHHSSADTDPPSAIIHSLSLPLEAQVREVFLRAGANLFSGFTFNRMSPEQVERHIEIVGMGHLKAALAENKGVIILLAHMGPWEALTQLPEVAERYGINLPFGAMYRPLNNRYLDDWYRKAREAKGTHLFSRRDGFHKPVDFLRGGGMLGILADQKLKRGELVPFFGVPAKTSPIAGLMQRRSGAPVLAASVSTVRSASWRIDLQPVGFSKHRKERSRTEEATICNRALEKSLSTSVPDGFWFHERF